MLPRKKWIPIAVILFVGLLLCEGYALLNIMRLGIIPDKYLIIIGSAMLLTIAAVAFLLFSGIGNGPGTARRFRRIIGLLLAILFGTGSILISHPVAEVDDTVQAITTNNTSARAIVGVYVKSGDTAEDLSDLSGSIGIMKDIDRGNTDAAMNYIQDNAGSALKVVERPGIEENASALLDGEVEAIAVNEAFITLLEENEAFADFESRAKLICEIPIAEPEEEKLPEAASVAAASSSESSAAARPVSTAKSKTPSIIRPAETGKPFLLYISGSDTRSHLLTTSRSDVNILMAVNPQMKQVLLLNTPRDYYVPNPAGGGALDKLTHCGIYGIDCSVSALEGLYGCDVDHYGIINFTGFETLIDAIGGITVEVPQSFSARGYSFTAGQMHMNGAQALVFARERYSFSSGDNERGRNQMRVITAVVEKITADKTGALRNYADILNSLEGMLSTDCTRSELSSMVKMFLNSPERWDVKSYAVTGSGGSNTTYSMPSTTAYVMYQNPDMVKTASSLVQKVLDGEYVTSQDVA